MKILCFVCNSLQMTSHRNRQKQPSGMIQEQGKTEEILNGSQTRLAFPTNIQNPLRITEYQAGEVVNKSALSAFWFTVLRRGREEALGGCSSPPVQPIGTLWGTCSVCPGGSATPGLWLQKEHGSLRLNQASEQRWHWSEEITQLSIQPFLVS